MKIKSNKLNAAVIGAGNIGAFFDNPKSRNILTHAHAYVKHPRFNLVGFVDDDLNKASKATKKWGGRAYKTIKELFSNEKIDALSICVPDDKHYEVLMKLKQYNFLGGIIEKPLSDKLADSKNLLKDKFFYNNFIVNYSRCYVPEYIKLQKKILNNFYGKFLHGNGLYCKGFFHSGSHMINLLQYFGFKFNHFTKNNKFVDYYKNDPSVSLVAFNGSKYFFHFDAVSQKNFDVFELNLVFEKGMIKVLHDGFYIEEYSVKKDIFFPSDKVLALTGRYETQKSRATYFLVDNLYKVLIKNNKPICSIQDAFNTQSVCENIINKSNS